MGLCKNMMTKRQNKILECLVREYIKSATPVSSKFLEKKFKFGVCPATLRNEMSKLTEMGYLEQPHTSAGRIPTDKAYRLLVDQMEQKEQEINLFKKEIGRVAQGDNDSLKFSDYFMKAMAEASSGLCLAYFLEKDFVLKEGWGEIFRNPEFKERGALDEFSLIVDSLERKIKEITEDSERFSEPKVFIGDEESFLGSNDFSLIISESKLPGEEQGFLAILGPKRMDYEKNISLMNSLIKTFNNY
jgi:transcriptional regulator of heat shock response